jgi:hypothetical protein
VLSKPDLLTMLVGLSSMNDTASVDEGRCLTSEVCTKEDRAAVREVAHSLDQLLKGFSYTASPEFARAVGGKSAAVLAMQRRLAEEPLRRAEHRARLIGALAGLLSKDEAYDLLPEARHQILDRIRASMGQVQNREH